MALRARLFSTPSAGTCHVSYDPATVFPLPENIVHVWRAALDDDENPASGHCLDADETARAGRFHFERDRRHYTAARGWLRNLLGRYLDAPPAALRFGYGPHGKPFLAEPAGRGLCFNVSHSHGRALLAFAREREVGVDLEAGARLGDDWPGLVRRVFSAREQAELAALPAALRRTAFLDGWTRKEAYLKATGLGITEGLQSIEVTLAPGQPPRLLRRAAEEPSSAALSWTIHDLRTDPQFAAALVTAGEDVAVARFDAAAYPPRG